MNQTARDMGTSSRSPRLDPIRRWLPSLLLPLLSVTGCAHQPPRAALDQVAAAPTVALRQAPSLREILARLADRRVIFVGETHDRYDNHLVQLAALEAAEAQSPGVAIGVEWFQRPYQQVLDDYVAGRIDEAQMLERSEYFSRWRFDYRLYRPILHYARAHRIPVVALNARAELTRAIGKGGLESLNAEQRRQLPAEYDRSNKAYEARLRQVFAEHPPGHKQAFGHFLDVQLTWDETMAETAADYLQAHPDRRMLIFAGAGHIARGDGIPDRLQRRLPVTQAILLASGEGPPDPRAADYLVLTSPQRLPPPGLMGAFLEDSDQGVRIAGFSEQSAAKAAGLAEGDILVAIDGHPTPTFAALKLLLLDRKPGDQVTLSYRHKGWLTGERAREVKIELR